PYILEISFNDPEFKINFLINSSDSLSKARIHSGTSSRFNFPPPSINNIKVFINFIQVFFKLVKITLKQQRGRVIKLFCLRISITSSSTFKISLNNYSEMFRK